MLTCLRNKNCYYDLNLIPRAESHSKSRIESDRHSSNFQRKWLTFFLYSLELARIKNVVQIHSHWDSRIKADWKLFSDSFGLKALDCVRLISNRLSLSKIENVFSDWRAMKVSFGFIQVEFDRFSSDLG